MNDEGDRRFFDALKPGDGESLSPNFSSITLL